MKSIKKLLVVTVVAILLCSMAVATVSATTDVKDEKKNSGIAIESKEKKVSSYKVTWDYNGGKIGSKKSKVTTVKRGSKIGKLAATPKKSGFIFKGWFTKKSGGKKISVNSKPTKNIVLYVHWTKKVSTSTNSKLIGTWRRSRHNFYTGFTEGETYVFNKNGKFVYYGDIYSKKTGNYKVSNGKITFTNIVTNYTDGVKRYFPTTIVAEYQFTPFNDQEHLKIRSMIENKTYYSIPVISFIKLQS